MKHRMLIHVLLGCVLALIFTSIIPATPYTARFPLMKAAVAEQPAQAVVDSTLVPRFLSLSVSAMRTSGAATRDEGVHFVTLPASGLSSATVDFTLPPDYVPGTPVTLRFMTYSLRRNCFNVLSLGGSYNTSEVGADLRVQFPGASTPSINPTWNAPEQNIRIFTVQLSSGQTYLFEPGAAIAFSLRRLGDDINDTCTGRLGIAGLSVIYQGQTSYLPLVTHQ